MEVEEAVEGRAGARDVRRGRGRLDDGEPAVKAENDTWAGLLADLGFFSGCGRVCPPRVLCAGCVCGA